MLTIHFSLKIDYSPAISPRGDCSNETIINQPNYTTIYTPNTVIDLTDINKDDICVCNRIQFISNTVADSNMPKEVPLGEFQLISHDY